MSARDEFFRHRAEVFQRRCDAVEKLLACYRAGSQPSDRLMAALAQTKADLDALTAFPPVDPEEEP